MTKEKIIHYLSKKVKLVRIENNYSQDRMAEILGMSKKTLVQIEKGRQNANWCTIVSLCALFPDSEIILSTLGSDPLEVLEVIAHETIKKPKERTLGGKIWWKELETRKGYRLQQNVISQHYRILDDMNYRYYSSFDKDAAYSYFNNL